MVFGLMFFLRLILFAYVFGFIFQSFAFIAVKVQLLFGIHAHGNGGIMNGLSIFKLLRL